MDINTKIKLNNGVEIPQLALGTAEIEDGGTVNAVKWAIEAGYRHFDTATYYNTEQGVGDGIAQSGLQRDEVFITTKIWNDDMRQHRVEASFEESLQRLGTDYVDLYLIHWPVAGEFIPTYQIMEKLYEQGRIRAIGVCNFNQHHMEELLQVAKYVPAVNQYETHPKMTQEGLRQYCRDLGIRNEAYSPLGSPRAQLLKTPALVELAEKRGRTPAQIVIRWHLQCGTIVLPKSGNKERIIQNSQVFDFALSAEEMALINGLNENQRIGPDPENFNF